MTSDIIEAAARALQDALGNTLLPILNRHIASIVLTAVTPLIRAQAFEEAALRIEADEEDYLMRNYVAAAIRTLKEQP